MKRLFNRKDITPSCSYCAHGKLSPDKESVLCLKKGIVSLDFSCKRFKYDPLKREPIRPKAIEVFEESDFSLDDFTLEYED
jgi:hypothetical protein